MSDKKRSLQLVFDKQIDAKNPFEFDINIPAQDVLPQQIQSLTRLEKLLRIGKFPWSRRNVPPKSRASKNILFAYDLDESGLSQREIAKKIYGKEAVSTGWDGATDHVRTKTRRLLIKGRELIKNGYSSFFTKC